MSVGDLVGDGDRRSRILGRVVEDECRFCINYLLSLLSSDLGDMCIVVTDPASKSAILVVSWYVGAIVPPACIATMTYHRAEATWLLVSVLNGE